MSYIKLNNLSKIQHAWKNYPKSEDGEFKIMTEAFFTLINYQCVEDHFSTIASLVIVLKSSIIFN